MHGPTYSFPRPTRQNILELSNALEEIRAQGPDPVHSLSSASTSKDQQLVLCTFIDSQGRQRYGVELARDEGENGCLIIHRQLGFACDKALNSLCSCTNENEKESRRRPCFNRP